MWKYLPSAILLGLFAVLLQKGYLTNLSFSKFPNLSTFVSSTTNTSAAPNEVSLQHKKLQIVFRDNSLDKLVKSQRHIVTGNRRQHDTIISIPDLHGDYEQAQKVLTLAGIIDSNDKWVAENITVIQTGDIVDRGPDSVRLMMLFEQLKAQAVSKNCNLITLLGNHEMMLLEGDFRYVAAKEIDYIANQLNADTTGNEDIAFDLRFRSYEVGTGKNVALPEKQQLVPVNKIPLEWRNQREHTKLVYMRWLTDEAAWMGAAMRRRYTLALLGNGHCKTLFSHAGLFPVNVKDILGPEEADTVTLTPAKAQAFVEAMNDEVNRLLHTCRIGHCTFGAQSNGLMGHAGPFWTRAGQQLQDEKLCPRVERLLQLLGAKRMVIGHNPQIPLQGEQVTENPGTFGVRCNKQLYLTDVGISRAYAGNQAAFKCSNGKVSALYADDEVVLEEAPSS